MSTIRQSMMWQRLGEYDTDLCIRFNRAAHRLWVRRFFVVVSRLGDGVFWYALMAVLALTYGMEGARAALHMFVVGLVGWVIYKSLKNTFVRARPFAVVQHIRVGTPPLDRYSFPSGHTLHAVSFTVTALAHYPGLAWLLIPFAALVALSRVILGLHYPTDVIAGAAIGAGLAVISMVIPW